MQAVVLDVNVIVSAAIRPAGTPGRIIAAWRRDELTVITSRPIMDKLGEVLHRQHIADVSTMDENDIQELFSLLEEEAIITPHALNLQVIEKDPEDDTILIAAVEGGADGIISGDAHLKDLGQYQGIPILTPADFVTQYNIL